MKEQIAPPETDQEQTQNTEPLPMEKSRLKNNLKKQAVRNSILAFLGIIILFIFIFSFGIPFLINFSLILEKFKGSSPTSTTEKSITYIAPPVLTPMESATNSATIKITGYSNKENNAIKLFVNGKNAGTTETGTDKKFTFSHVSLDQGSNEIKAKTVASDDKESDYSNPIKISYSNKAPSLEINAPQDGLTLKDDHQTVSGKTETGTKVTVNDFWAIVDDQGKFTYNIKLQSGENKIKVEATDDAGNKTTKEIKVTYAP